MTQKLSLPLYLSYLLRRVFARFKSRWAVYRLNRLKGPRIASMGAYFSGNLGDYAMGVVLRQAFAARDTELSLISHDQLSRVQPELLICGGGELGDEAYFRDALSCVQKPSDLRIIGISPYAKLHQADEALIAKLAQVNFFSVRNKWAHDYLQGLLQANHVTYSPDLVFALPKVAPAIFKRLEQIKPPKQPIVSINLIPYGYSINRRGELVIDQEHLAMLVDLYPDKAAAYQEMSARYLQYTHGLIESLIAQGNKVRVISFSVGDYFFAKHFYSTLAVDILPYSVDIEKTLTAIKESTVFYTARFHSMIFAMLAQTPAIPFCYSMKCNNLLNDLLDTHNQPFADREMLISKDPNSVHEYQLQTGAVELAPDALDRVSDLAYNGIQSLLDSVSFVPKANGRD